jgi:hypothetical protein
MESKADKQRARLRRYMNLRVWAVDPKTREALEELIKQTEERLRELENAIGDRNGIRS